MADSRSLSFGVQFGTDTAPLDELNEKQRKAQEEAEQTADKLEQIGTSLTDVGTRATAAFNNVSGAGTKMGTSVRSAMLESIKQGDSLAKTLRTGLGAAVSNVQAKFKGMGAATKSVATDIGNAFKHPIQTIKATLGKALNGAEEDARGLGTQADDTGRRLDDMGKKGAGAGENLVGVLKKVAAAAAGLAIIKKGVEAIKEFCGAAIDAAANAEETNSKFETVFKGAADATNTWAENFAAAAHRSKNEVKGFLADSGAIFTGIGMGAEDASAMSEMMTSLSYDLASFNNLADEDAFNKLRSGLMGETEGLKSMGIVLNDTAIKQSMLQMGITDEFNTLDEATKVQVRWNAILAQTGDAQQDVTRTAGSYTNSVKGVKGIWADFLADAGAKFTPVLTTFFNTIIDSWPTIEPMLMQLVDLLADGLSQAIPILVQLGSQLLPVFCDALALIFQVMQPLIPVIGNLAATLLPPLASILSMLVGALLPPLTTILNVVCNDILVPLMPIISTIASAILPPIAQLLGVVAPLLQAIAPILQVIGQMLTIVADVIGTIIGWVADGVGAVVNFFDNLFGGAKEAQGGMEDLAESTNSVASSIPDIGTIEMPAVEIPDRRDPVRDGHRPDHGRGKLGSSQRDGDQRPGGNRHQRERHLRRYGGAGGKRVGPHEDGGSQRCVGDDHGAAKAEKRHQQRGQHHDQHGRRYFDTRAGPRQRHERLQRRPDPHQRAGRRNGDPAERQPDHPCGSDREHHQHVPPLQVHYLRPADQRYHVRQRQRRGKGADEDVVPANVPRRLPADAERGHEHRGAAGVSGVRRGDECLIF